VQGTSWKFDIDNMVQIKVLMTLVTQHNNLNENDQGGTSDAMADRILKGNKKMLHELKGI
jgi:hypothetical protein